MACEERQRLSRVYEDATKSFAQAVSQLGTSRGNSTLDNALRKTEEARGKCDKARRALRHHKNQHDC